MVGSQSAANVTMHNYKYNVISDNKKSISVINFATAVDAFHYLHFVITFIPAKQSKDLKNHLNNFSVNVFSTEHQLGTLSRSNWNLEVLVFEEGGKPKYPEKNLSEQG